MFYEWKQDYNWEKMVAVGKSLVINKTLAKVIKLWRGVVDHNNHLREIFVGKSNKNNSSLVRKTFGGWCVFVHREKWEREVEEKFHTTRIMRN